MNTTTIIKPSYIKADNNKIINEKMIRWVRKIDECLEVCSKNMGCFGNGQGDTHIICKQNNSDSYNYLNKYFE